MMNETNLFEFGDLLKKYYFYRPNQYFSDGRNIYNSCMRNGKLRMGMVEGGANAFIGAGHRSVVLFMKNEIELIRGGFSRNNDGKRQPWID